MGLLGSLFGYYKPSLDDLFNAASKKMPMLEKAIEIHNVNGSRNEFQKFGELCRAAVRIWDLMLNQFNAITADKGYKFDNHGRVHSALKEAAKHTFRVVRRIDDERKKFGTGTQNWEAVIRFASSEMQDHIKPNFEMAKQLHNAFQADIQKLESDT